MNKARSYFFASIIAIGLLFTSCSLTTDLEDIHSTPLPDLENTDGNAGGTGGSNPPPPGG
ncbi:MAG: hypothetical protein R8G66_15010 [Cytophagales bacterium]|nr:hypothetical protein [Cytophagales bacterium]